MYECKSNQIFKFLSMLVCISSIQFSHTLFNKKDHIFWFLDVLIIKSEPAMELYDDDDEDEEDDDVGEGTFEEDFLINAMGAFNGMLSSLYYCLTI